MDVEQFLGRVERAKRSGRGWIAQCPAHDDHRRSLSVAEGDEGRVLITCFAGCPFERIVAAVGLKPSDMFPNRDKGAGIPRPLQASVQRSRGLTLAQYATAKGLPVDELRSYGLTDMSYLGASAVRIPYLDEKGEAVAVRVRLALTGDDRFLWRKGSKPMLYGLCRMGQARELGYTILVEGESDSHVLWHHGYPAIGLPGAGLWRDDRDAGHVEGLDTVYVVLEPDTGGKTVLRWVSESRIADRVRFIRLPVKDVADLHADNPDGFVERFEVAMQSAVPFAQVDELAREVRHREAWQASATLAQQPAILHQFTAALADVGLAGEHRTAQIIYLALVSRLLERPVSVAVKGPSSGGKSFVVNTVLKFMPQEAMYELTAMSERALAYSTEPLAHRVLVLYEAAGLGSDFQNYLLRTLLSEGRVRYEVVEKTAEGLRPRLIERAGPTGLVLTTTATSLHPENETRLLSLTVEDTREQTHAVMRAIASERQTTLDFEPWHQLQQWLATGPREVTVPFATELADLVEPVAVRLRRDFGQTLQLIRAHALLHQATRERDTAGRVIAVLDDYEAVRELVADVIAQAVEVTVPVKVRELVEAVSSVEPASADLGVTLTTLSEMLQLDTSSVSRRAKLARDAGWLRDVSQAKNRLLLRTDAPMPNDKQLLPSSDLVDERCSVARNRDRVPHPLPSKAEAA